MFFFKSRNRIGKTVKDLKPLIDAALETKSNSFSPYSRFRVGAALMTKKGKIYTGCNIESSSYGLTVCAERVAIYNAVSNASHDFQTLVVATDAADFCPPCGACRQVIWDFANDIDIILVNKDGNQRAYHIRDLYPHAFSSSFISDSESKK